MNWDVTWQLDISIDDYTLPSRHAIGKLVTDDTFNRENVRVSTEGLSSMSHNMGLILGGSTLEETMYRPHLILPDLMAVVRALAAEGDMTAETSSAGAFLLAACRRFGGLSAFASAVSDGVSGGV